MAFFSCNNNSCNISLARHLCDFIGETVTIFTTSGGPSGCGFTGCVLSVNQCFVRLLTDIGSPPSSPIADNICGDFDGKSKGLGFDAVGGVGIGPHRRDDRRKFGSVCDIPIENIAHSVTMPYRM